MITESQIALVQSSFRFVLPIAETAGLLFYERIFTLAPETRALFDDDIGPQAKRTMAAVRTAVDGLGSLDIVGLFLVRLGARQVRYGVRAEHFEVVGVALLWTLEQGLGERFTPAVRDAWVAAWDVIAGAMRTGMRWAEAALEPEPAPGAGLIAPGSSAGRALRSRPAPGRGGGAQVGGGGHHHLGDEVVGAPPRRFQGVVPHRGEVGGERSDERLADGVVVLRLHPVADVAGGEIADPGGEGVEGGDRLHDGVELGGELHRHDVGAVGEQRFGRRVGGEQTVVEVDRHRRRGVAERGVRGSHELELFGCHGRFPSRPSAAARAARLDTPSLS
jgi:nitric oxide dioxygenase